MYKPETAPQATASVFCRRAAALQQLGRLVEACGDLDRAMEACTTKGERQMISKRQQELVKAMETAGCGLQPSGGALPPQRHTTVHTSTAAVDGSPGAPAAAGGGGVSRPAAAPAAGSTAVPDEHQREPSPEVQQVERPVPEVQAEEEHGKLPAHDKQQAPQADRKSVV